ncbi:hypothetical protein VTN49DRAFT_69 [Thermomyces lanuginosus]|uniref:uncharacterized protein n=1 Tax=Thermomyces lanuginosus TaxID=5541 RepID=UPI003743D0D0
MNIVLVYQTNFMEPPIVAHTLTRPFFPMILKVFDRYLHSYYFLHLYLNSPIPVPRSTQSTPYHLRN